MGRREEADNPRLGAALGYAGLGWPVHPVRDRSKVPHLRHWPTRASTDPDALRGWWTKWPDANVGVLTGRASGVVVVDEDPRNGGDLGALGPLPETAELLVEDRAGRRLFYRHIDALRSRKDFRPGIDLLADRRFALVPPSVHPTGGPYFWDRPEGPRGMAPLPPWLAVAAGTPRVKGQPNAAEGDATSARPAGRRLTLDQWAEFTGLWREIGVDPGDGGLAPCPFHDDTTPSLSIDVDHGLFHCFGCQAGGGLGSLRDRVRGGARRAKLDRPTWRLDPRDVALFDAAVGKAARMGALPDPVALDPGGTWHPPSTPVPLQVRELADRTGVGRSTVSEWRRRLVYVGLLEPRPGTRDDPRFVIRFPRGRPRRPPRQLRVPGRPRRGPRPAFPDRVWDTPDTRRNFRAMAARDGVAWSPKPILPGGSRRPTPPTRRRTREGSGRDRPATGKGSSRRIPDPGVPADQERTTTYTSLGVPNLREPWGVDVPPSHDSWRHGGGLGKGGWVVYRTLLRAASPLTARELADITAIPSSTVYRLLGALERAGLARKAEGCWSALRRDLDEVAREIGTAGRGLRQRRRHRSEQAAYRR